MQSYIFHVELNQSKSVGEIIFLDICSVMLFCVQASHVVKTYFISNSTVFDKSYYLLLTLVVLYSVVHFII